MPDCGMCRRPLGGQLRRCKHCGACESCCLCDWEEPSEDDIFSPAELGLDPEDYDVEYWNRRRKRA